MKNSIKTLLYSTVLILFVASSCSKDDSELVKEGGIRYVYTPAMTRIQFNSTVVRNVLRGLFESFGESAISYLIQSTGIEDEETSEDLRKSLEKLKEE